MPTYQYACTECGHDFEIVQSFAEDSLTVCPECGGRLRKVFNAVGVVFKGSGFYRNDSRGKQSSSESGGSGTKSESSTSTPAAESSSGSSSGSGKDSSAPTTSSSSSSSANGGSTSKPAAASSGTSG